MGTGLRHICVRPRSRMFQEFRSRLILPPLPAVETITYQDGRRGCVRPAIRESSPRTSRSRWSMRPWTPPPSGRCGSCRPGVVDLLLAGCLFAELGYLQVWVKLTAGLSGLPVARPSAAALSQARRRLTRQAYAVAARPATRPGACCCRRHRPEHVPDRHDPSGAHPCRLTGAGLGRLPLPAFITSR